MPAIVAVEDVGKTYTTVKGDEVVALQDITLSVQKEETVAIVGPSGCGKSTLLRLIAGVEKQTMERSSARLRRTLRRRLCVQDSSLMRWRTVYDNIKLPLEVTKKRITKDRPSHRDDRHEGVREGVSVELSGGMQRRVSIARAFVHEPSIVS